MRRAKVKDKQTKSLVDPAKPMPGLDQVKRWIKVDAPEPWKPKNAGDSIEGLYVGTDFRPGFNQTEFQVWFISTHTKMYYVYGTAIASLFQSAQLQVDEPVRIIFKGTQETANGNMRKFDLFKGVE